MCFFMIKYLIVGESVKKTLQKMDKPLFFLMVAFTILGLVMIFSASSITAVLYNKVEESYFFKRQLLFVLVSWIAGFSFFLRFPTKKYKVLAPLSMIGIVLIIFLLIPYGAITNSAKSWFNLGFFSFQPSEFLKPIMIVYLAVYLEKIISRDELNITKLITPLILVLLGCGLIAMQPDFGTALIVACIAGMIFLAIPNTNASIKKIKIAGVITGLVCLIIILTGDFLNKEQMSRFVFKNPCTRYTEKTGYQVCNGFIAINNGGLFGVGLGNSTQKYLYLPEAHTDFIFPIIIEELGAVVGVIIIICYGILLSRLIKIAKKSSTIRGKYIAYGTFCYILVHLLINFMGVLALIPLTGVPVPFLSYGGSFYISLICLLFVCERVAIETNNNKTKELIRSI